MLKNIAVAYDPLEDRIVLRLTVLDEGAGMTEHLLHLTRRVCAALRPDLQAVLDLSAEVPASLDRAARAAVSTAHHQAMASLVPVRNEPAMALPPAAVRPRLVQQAICGRRRADQRWVLRFEFGADTPALSMLLSGSTLHALVHALSKRVQAAQWALASLPHEREPAPSTPTTPTPGLH